VGSQALQYCAASCLLLPHLPRRPFDDVVALCRAVVEEHLLVGAIVVNRRGKGRLHGELRVLLAPGRPGRKLHVEFPVHCRVRGGVGLAGGGVGGWGLGNAAGQLAAACGG
jgi:hypothetical protein